MAIQRYDIMILVENNEYSKKLLEASLKEFQYSIALHFLTGKLESHNFIVFLIRKPIPNDP